ncbi:helix-turn-helix domain-containing protein [Flavobacterium anhuiense]|uniref:helix-turn-helix domain-containing protein n=1 Tax=Flavobacterium anhuiense TaxID=459526 RepID=UPI000E6C1A91|nr:helix-turn-helix domain-containing protein [Flavobacterium anhuiense]
MIKHVWLLTIVLLIAQISNLYSQTKNLLQKDYESLEEMIDQLKGRPDVFPYLNAYLEKAKKEENLDEVINGYKNYIYEVEYGQKIAYSDSVLIASELTKKNDKIGSALLTKGIVYYSGKDYNKALDCYLSANKLIASGSDDYLKYKTQYNIALVKYYLGFYNEAVSILLKCAYYFRDKNSRAYLNCLHSLSLCYTKLGNYHQSADINDKAVQESGRLKDSSMLSYLKHSEGVNDYYRKFYSQAVAKLNSSLPELEKQKDFANIAVAYFYIANSYWDSGKRELAYPFLMKVDEIFTDTKYIRPDLRKTYEMLIDYYRGKTDRESELLYTTKLIQADKILHTNYKYLSSRIYKEYDTARLINNNVEIRHELNTEKKMRRALLALSCLMIPIAGYLGYRNFQLRRYKKNFGSYKKTNMLPLVQNTSRAHRPNISDDLEEGLLKKLAKFEETLGYLKKDLKIEKLARSFGTNYKYLSQVINYHKGMSYPDYISSLRIAYIVKKLEEDSKLRNYNFGVIAEEAGFGTAQQFNDVFKKKMGMPFAYFLSNLNNELI